MPIDDIKETVTALQCFGYLSTTPIQIFIQMQDGIYPDSRQQEHKVAVNNTHSSENGSIIKLTEKLSQLESTIQILGQRIVTLLENLSESFCFCVLRICIMFSNRLFRRESFTEGKRYYSARGNGHDRTGRFCCDGVYFRFN